MEQTQRNYIAVDDSGDVGLKAGASGFFAVAAIVFNDALEAESASLEAKKFKRAIRWRDDHEFKFNKMRRELIIRLLEVLAPFDFKVYSLYIDKGHIALERVPPDWDSVYNQVILEVLGHVPMHEAVVRIDGRYGKKYQQKMEGYFRRELNKSGHRVDNVRFVDSKENTLVQIADIAVGSVNRSLQTNKTDSQDYIGLLKGKIELLDEFWIG
ncbi:MAG: DUF3800 domain-containing protein [Coriobacteriales bacterium]|jgi:hypothetical protein|nr:DUF3800 domain-containing protein [Coriobacteriales bacterium]